MRGRERSEGCLLPALSSGSKSSSLRSRPHPALRATFSRKREKGSLSGTADYFSPRLSSSGSTLGSLPRKSRYRVARSTVLPREKILSRKVWPFSRRSEEHTSELQSLMRISYAVFCLKKNIITY